MTDFRNPKNLEHFEYVSFYPDTAIGIPPAGENQKVNGYRFSVDNSTDPHPMDWFESFIAVKFKVQEMDETAVAANAQVSTINSIYSFFEKVIFKFNGVALNQSPNINRCMWVKNLLKYSKSYETAATSSFDYLDENRLTKITQRVDNDANYTIDAVTPATKRSGFYKRHTAITNNAVVDAVVALNRYGFFEKLKNEILPQGTVTIDITLENSNNLIYRTGGNPMKVIITHMMLYVPKLIFNGDGEKLYYSNYLRTHSWTYLRESYNETTASQATHGSFNIATSIKQPRHVFVWGVQDNRENSQTNNIFLAETFSMGGNAHLTSAQLELGNGNYYPLEVLNPWNNLEMAYRELMSFGGAYNDPLSGPRITFDLFKTVYPILYFNLDNQPETLRSGSIKITFRWQLDGAPAAACKWCAVVLNEETISINKTNNRVTLKN